MQTFYQKKNATIVLKLPGECETDSQLHIEFLHSYTTNGVVYLFSLPGGSNATHFESVAAKTFCDEQFESKNSWKFVATFNSSNDEKVSVSNTMKFQIDRGVSYVKGIVFGGDFHLLSLGIYCS
jgi:hypothetical protein